MVLGLLIDLFWRRLGYQGLGVVLGLEELEYQERIQSQNWLMGILECLGQDVERGMMFWGNFQEIGFVAGYQEFPDLTLELCLEN